MILRQLMYRIFFILVGFLVAVTVVEGFLRLFPALVPVEVRHVVEAREGDFGVGHPYIGHLHTPNYRFVLSGRDFRATHNTDGYGFRNSWPWPNSADVVALGDSLTFGQTVEDDQAWPAVLDGFLPRSRVINLGLIGAGFQQYLRVYETFGIKLRPKLLLVGVFVRNDFWDDALFERWLASGAQNYMVWRDFGRETKRRFDSNQSMSDLIETVRSQTRRVTHASRLYNVLRYIRRIPTAVKIFHSADGTRMQLLPADFAEKTRAAQPGTREFQRAIKALQRIHSLAAGYGTKTVILLQPSKEEVYLPLLGETVVDVGEAVRRELQNSGIVYLDLTPSFRQRAQAGEKLFHEGDGHPNLRGYALIAESVVSDIKANAAKYDLQDWPRPAGLRG